MKNLLPLFLALLILSSCKKKTEIVAVQSVTIDKATANVYLDATLQLTATVLPENATSKEVTWDSSDPSTANVAGGIVTPSKQGEVTISATAGGITATCKVTVGPPFVAVTGISLDRTAASLNVEDKITLKAEIAPENATDKTVEWSSDKENIATVSGGVVTGVALGTCTITAKSLSDQTKTAACQVTILAKGQEIPVSGISVEPKTANILVNETRELKTTITPENATHKGVTWSTSDAAIAEVSPAGVVTAKKEGTATITVAGVSNSAMTATCAVTVTNQVMPVTGITVDPAETTLAVNTTFQLTPRIEPATATNVNVIYESNDLTKATVSETGLVTAGSTTGETTITLKSAADATKTATFRLTIRPRVTSITVSPDAATLSTGQKQQLTAAVMPSDAANKTVTWSSADESKATVSNSGEVTAVASGEVHITATAKDGSSVTGLSTLTIVTGVAGITLVPTQVGIIIREMKTITAIIAPATAANKNVLWTSDKEDIATVSEGVITARAVGTCTITAKSAADQSKMATCAVTVSLEPIPITGISVTPVAASILLNGTRELTASVLPENATNRTVTWSTSDASIAEVSPAGMVTAKRVGTAIITATGVSNSDMRAACTITVTNQEVAVTGLTVDPADITIITAASFQLIARILPLNSTNVNVTFVSGDETKAAVSETGLVTAVSAGQTTITVRSVADPTKTAVCNLTITSASVLVQSITVAPESTSVATGLKQQLTATVLLADAANKTVTWSSADPLKATVSESGEVTAVTVGQVVITATANDGSGITGRSTVTVVPRVTTLTLSPENPTVLVGQTRALTATILPADATPSVIWSSGDQSKATINAATGVATGVVAGTVTITATSTDGSGVTGTVTLTVQPLPVSNAVISNFTIRAENFILGISGPRASTTFNNAPRTLSTTRASVELEITATEGAIIKIGSTDFTGQRVNFTNPVTFTVTEAGKSGSKSYTLTIPPYNKATNPYGIYSTAHLHDMRNAMREGYKLLHDLTMPDASAGFPGISDYATQGWLPIGDATHSFAGILDGAGHKIDNLYAHRQSLEFVGLFARLDAQATIKNLGVNATTGMDKGVGGENSTGLQYSGILSGHNNGTIEDCYTTGRTFSVATATTNPDPFSHAGGLVAAHEYGHIRRCYSTARVSSATTDGASDCFAGGLVGYCRAAVSDCYATGDVFAVGDTHNAHAYAGGLVATCPDGAAINRCYATGNVVAQSSATTDGRGAFSGGLMGHCASSSINNCYALGKATALSITDKNITVCVAGFLGHANSHSTISNSYGVGDADSSVDGARTYVGGFMAYTLIDFTNCYRNSNATVKAANSVINPSDRNTANITARSRESMQTDAFKGDLNKNQSSAVWGRSSGKNSDLPYLIGVGAGKD